MMDTAERWPVVASEKRFEGRVISVRTDSVRMPDGSIADRDVVEHPGSVGVLPLDDQNRVLLILQYRHPAGHRLWEVPAGIRDVPGEPLWRTAERELAEEAGFRATRWHSLVDVFTSPGMTDERIRVFLARGLTEIPAAENTFQGIHEETELPLAWLPLEDAVQKVLAGEIHNAIAVMGILAAYTASADRFARLRPADAPEG